MNLMERLRAANPVPAVDHGHDTQLWNEIVATPGDARLARRRPAVPRRGVALVAVLATVAATAGAAVVGPGLFARSTPNELFAANPAAEDAGTGTLWHASVISGSARVALTLRVPGVGTVEYWTASTREGRICSALRLPGGVWAGTGSSPLDQGGSVPGCVPTREQINSVGAVYVVDGFDYTESVLGPPGGPAYRVEYGAVRADASAVRVRDVLSGASARVAGGRYFALVLPASDTQWQLEALDARGSTLARER